MGDGFQFSGAVNGNANLLGNWNDLSTGLPATALPHNANGDVVAFLAANITSGTVDAPIEALNGHEIYSGVQCNFDVTNANGQFNGTCSGYLNDTAGSGCNGMVVDGGAFIVGAGFGTNYKFTATSTVTGPLILAGTINIANSVINRSCQGSSGSIVVDYVVFNGGSEATYNFSGKAAVLFSTVSSTFVVTTGIFEGPNNGYSYQFDGAIDGNANNFLNWYNLTISSRAWQVPYDGRDSVDSVVAEITSGTINTLITDLGSEGVVDFGVLVNGAVTNNTGVFSGTASGYLTDLAGSGSSNGPILNGGGSISAYGATWNGMVQNGSTLTVTMEVTLTDFTNNNGLTVMQSSMAPQLLQSSSILGSLTATEEVRLDLSNTVFDGGPSAVYDLSQVDFPALNLGPATFNSGTVILPIGNVVDGAGLGNKYNFSNAVYQGTAKIQLGFGGQIVYPTSGTPPSQNISTGAVATN